MNKFGFARVTCVTPRVHIANPRANADVMIDHIKDHCDDSDVILTPELSVSSYSAGKLFHNIEFQNQCKIQTLRIANEVPHNALTVVGVPLAVGDALYNTAIVLNQGRPIAAVPKEFVPNYNEFEEGQWFAMARENRLPSHIDFCGKRIPFSTRLLFKAEPSVGAERENEGMELVVFIEICEAIWMIIPPSSFGSIAGANVLLNPSSSTEIVGKQEQRRYHVLSQSSRCQAAYAYCSSGPTESSSDVVMGGHNMIAEGGHMCEESVRVGDGQPPERGSYHITADVDVQKLMNDRRQQTSYTEARKWTSHMQFTTIPFVANWQEPGKLKRHISALPFVPSDGPSLKARCAEVFGIQTHAFAQRLETITGYSINGKFDRKPNLSIGISGGLDSTLAAMVTKYTLEMLGVDLKCVHAVTMPGFGTSERTKGNADRLMMLSDFRTSTIDIRPACLEEYKILSSANGYKPFGIIDMNNFAGPVTDSQIEAFTEMLANIPKEQRNDLTFENVQARRRTEYLMNLGFVIGTGDMSELFQGWCTYNADQQSMFNDNCSIPKTLIRFLVKYIAREMCLTQPRLRDVLMDIADTPISPELLPLAADGSIEQSTEDVLGPYELIDFLMFHTIRNGFSPAKILYLGDHAKGWENGYTREERRVWHKVHYERFFKSQFKRDNVPNGPKVGSVSLSPRSGNWRMPSDAEWHCWTEALQNLE